MARPKSKKSNGVSESKASDGVSDFSNSNSVASALATTEHYGKAVVYVVSAFLAFIGIYEFFFDNNLKDLTIYCYNFRPVLIDKEFAGGASIEINGTSIQSDVNALYVGIWNAGKSAILKSDLKKAITLRLPGKKVLSAKIIKNSRTENKMACKLKTDDLESVEFHFDFLEYNDAAICQLIYEGKAVDDIFVEGVIIDQKDKKISKVVERAESIRRNRLSAFNPFQYTKLLGGFILGFFWKAFFNIPYKKLFSVSFHFLKDRSSSRLESLPHFIVIDELIRPFAPYFKTRKKAAFVLLLFLSFVFMAFYEYACSNIPIHPSD